MRASPTRLPDVRLITSDVHSDDRGWLTETFRADALSAMGLPTAFAQENRTLSHQGVLRGLHFQERHAQGKLVQVVQGEIYDVAVDIRQGSPTLGRFVDQTLSDQRADQLWVPAGFAHGFYVTRGPAVVVYKLTTAYAPQWDRCLAWDDPDLAIPWPVTGSPVLSRRDQRGMSWRQIPRWRADPALGPAIARADA